MGIKNGLKCCYCNRPLRNNFTIFWPDPHSKTQYKCDRKVCDWETAIKKSMKKKDIDLEILPYMVYHFSVIAIILFLFLKGFGYV